MHTTLLRCETVCQHSRLWVCRWWHQGYRHPLLQCSHQQTTQLHSPPAPLHILPCPSSNPINQGVCAGSLLCSAWSLHAQCSGTKGGSAAKEGRGAGAGRQQGVSCGICFCSCGCMCALVWGLPSVCVPSARNVARGRGCFAGTLADTRESGCTLVLFCSEGSHGQGLCLCFCLVVTGCWCSPCPSHIMTFAATAAPSNKQTNHCY